MVWIYKNEDFKDYAVCIALTKKRAIKKFNKYYAFVYDYNVYRSKRLLKGKVEMLTY